MRKVIGLVLISLFFSSATSAIETRKSIPDQTLPDETYHSSYIGTGNGFAVHRIEILKSRIAVDLIVGMSGGRALLVSSAATGASQSFALPDRIDQILDNKDRSRPQNSADAQMVGTEDEVETRPIIVRSDGSGFYAIYVNGELVGFLSISSSGTFTFTPWSKVAK